MKKIVGILGVAIMAIAIYTNLSLIEEELHIADINLASVIQNAHALSEDTDPNCRYKEPIIVTDSYQESNPCRIVTTTSTGCSGTGSVCCLRGIIQTIDPC